MPKGERHAPWTPEECAAMGHIGGTRAGVSKRQRKCLSQIADDLLSRPCQGKDVLDALEAAGFEVYRGKSGRQISNAVAMTANIIRIGQGMDSKAAVLAYRALAEMERIQAEREAAEVHTQAGGVVLLPPADTEDPYTGDETGGEDG